MYGRLKNHYYITVSIDEINKLNNDKPSSYRKFDREQLISLYNKFISNVAMSIKFLCHSNNGLPLAE
jgi:hypothetical protein